MDLIPNYHIENLAETNRRIQELFKAGTAPTTLIAYRSDLEYFWTWAKIALNIKEPCYPIPKNMLIQFIIDHLYGLNDQVEKRLMLAGKKARPGPHSINTVQRRISSLSVAHQYQGIEENPCAAKEIKMLLRKARRAAVKDGKQSQKKRAITLDLLFRLIGTCNGESLIDLRDRAILLVAFATGGRRRSEVVAMRHENLTPVDGGYTWILPSSKTDQDGIGLPLPILGRPAEALKNWIKKSGERTGFVFRGITKGGNLLPSKSNKYGIAPYTVCRIVKKRSAMAGLDPQQFSAHSLRSGFITEAGKQGKPIQDIMALSGHRSIGVAIGYYQAGNAVNNSAAQLVG